MLLQQVVLLACFLDSDLTAEAGVGRGWRGPGAVLVLRIVKVFRRQLWRQSHLKSPHSLLDQAAIRDQLLNNKQNYVNKLCLQTKM